MSQSSTELVSSVSEKIGEKEAIESHTKTLFKAIAETNDIEVELLVKQGVELEAVDKNGRTPLMAAVGPKHEFSASRGGWFTQTDLSDDEIARKQRIAKILLDKGANLEAVDTTGMTPLKLSIQSGVVKMFEFLMQEDPNVNRNAPLVFALEEISRIPDYETFEKRYDYFLIAHKLIAKGANVNYIANSDSFRTNPLLILLSETWQGAHSPAFLPKLLSLLDAMLKAGLDLNLTDGNDSNALHYILDNASQHPQACQFKDCLTAYLIDKGINLHQQNKQQKTPLAYLPTMSQKSIELLMQHVDLTVPLNKFNDTAFLLAARHGCIMSLDILWRRIKSKQISEEDIEAKEIKEAKEIQEAFFNLGAPYTYTLNFQVLYGDSTHSPYDRASNSTNIKCNMSIINTLKWFLKRLNTKTILSRLPYRDTPGSRDVSWGFLLNSRNTRNAAITRIVQSLGTSYVSLHQEITNLILEELISRNQINFLSRKQGFDLFLKPKAIGEFADYLSQQIGAIAFNELILPSRFSNARLAPWLKSEKQQLCPYWSLVQHKNNVYWDSKQKKERSFIFCHLPEELKARILLFLEKMPSEETSYKEYVTLKNGKSVTFITSEAAKSTLDLLEARLEFVQTLAFEKDKKDEAEGKAAAEVQVVRADKGDSKSNTPM